MGEAGTLPVSPNPPARAWPPRGREDRTLGLTVTASSSPNPGPPGGLAATAAPGSGGFGRGRGPPSLRAAAGGLAAPGDLSPFPGTARSFPACPAPRSRPDPAPGLCHRRGAGSRSAPGCVLQPQPEVGAPAAPGCGSGAPGGPPALGEGVGDRGAAWGAGSPPGRRFVAAAVLARAQTWRKLELRAREPRAVRALAPRVPPGLLGVPGGRAELRR